MISRIRMDAYGRAAEDVANVLENHAKLIEEMLGVSVCFGEQVIERQLDAPRDSALAWRGRMNLHPDISGAAA